MYNKIQEEWNDMFGIFGNTNHTKLHKQVQENNKTTLHVNVAGYTPELVNVNIEGHTIKISVDDKDFYNPLSESLKLEFEIAPTTSPQPISAEIKNGLLTLVFERINESKDTKIKVTY